MNIESLASFESLVDCISDGTLTLQRFLTISERLGAVSNQSWTALTPTTALYQINYCRACLERACMESKCPHINHLETFTCARNRFFHKKRSGHTSNNANGHSPIGLRRRRPFRTRRSSSCMKVRGNIEPIDGRV